tara:strand:+ start:261207 stop:261536 length:330 start_codon:yes stop_codon:yes gene_type:complete
MAVGKIAGAYTMVWTSLKANEMVLDKLRGYGAAVCLLTLLAGCSFGGPDFSGERAMGPDSVVGSAQCQSNPRSCNYEGRYESDERAYAEHEAVRLNQLELERLRRGGRW